MEKIGSKGKWERLCSFLAVYLCVFKTLSQDTTAHNADVMISIVYGSPAAGSGNKRAALIGGHGRHLRPIFANWLY
jgi:hypothetical protein